MRGIPWSVLILGLSGVARAGDVVLQSAGAPVMVVYNGAVLGPSPVTLKDVAAGNILLGFREGPLAPTAFSQTIAVPAQGQVVWEVDLPARTAKPVAAPAAAPAGTPPAVAPTTPAAPATSAAPTAAAPPPKTSGKGDLYVSSSPSGAAIWVDGRDMGLATPAMVPGVSAGPHTVAVRTDCTRAEQTVQVAPGVITRAELAPVAGTGDLTLTAVPTGALLVVDGVERGPAPQVVPGLSCDTHEVVARAPGYLETRQHLRVPAYTSTPLNLVLAREEFGTLVVEVVPLEASVRVDGVDVGAGPRTLDHVATGPHHVEGILAGYTTDTDDVTVRKDQIARASLKLERAPEVAARPPKAPKAPRPPRAHDVPVGRLLVNTGVSALSVTAGVLAAQRYSAARGADDVYLAEPDPTLADALYQSSVRPGLTQAAVLGGGAAVGGVLSAVLWVRTEF